MTQANKYLSYGRTMLDHQMELWCQKRIEAVLAGKVDMVAAIEVQIELISEALAKLPKAEPSVAEALKNMETVATVLTVNSVDSLAARENWDSRRQWLLENKKLKIECPDPGVVAICTELLWAKFGGGAENEKPKKVECRENGGGARSWGGRRDSHSAGGASVESFTSKSSDVVTAKVAKDAEFLGKARSGRRNRKKLKYVKAGARVVVRRWSDKKEFGPFDVVTAGRHFVRVRNPVSGDSGRICRRKFGTFFWEPPRASRSVDPESGEEGRSLWSSWSPRSGAWSCPGFGWRSGKSVPIGPYCCRSVCRDRVDPGPWFGPIIGRYGVASYHTCQVCRSS